MTSKVWDNKIIRGSREEDPDMPPSQARMGKEVPNFSAMTTDGLIGQVSHQHLLSKNWPLGDAVKRICFNSQLFAVLPIFGLY